MRIHIVAVSGTGMGSLAGLLCELGHDVSGSDVAFDPPMGPALAEWGVRCLTGFDAAHLEPAPDLVIVGNVCRPDNVEARAALDRGLSTTHIGGALARFVLENTSPLVVAGTHGKTTTTSIAAWLLDRTDFQPGFLIGGLPANFPRSFRAPGPRRLTGGLGVARRAPFVIEGDEYDTAFFEKTAKFLHYRPEVAIATSIEHDHIDIYPTLDTYLEAFARFVRLIPEHGLLVANAADPHVRELARTARAAVAYFALEGEDTGGVAPHWLAAPAETRADGASFDLFGPALAEFRGVQRRQELVGTPGGVLVYDDFAHHPSAVRETLLALRERHPEGRLVAVFEPRSATACRRIHQHDYPPAFAAADAVLLAPLGRSNLAPEEALDLAALAAELRGLGKHADACATLDAVLDRIAELARPGDLVALLSNGAFGGMRRRVGERLSLSRAAESAAPNNDIRRAPREEAQ